jgi:hypothetical protein
MRYRNRKTGRNGEVKKEIGAGNGKKDERNRSGK